MIEYLRSSNYGNSNCYLIFHVELKIRYQHSFYAFLYQKRKVLIWNYVVLFDILIKCILKNI